MNISHLRYAIEIERHGSITKAAETLFMNQPNLSKAVRELEQSVGISIFQRTPKGVKTTPEGVEFLQRAKKILQEIDEVESMYRPGANKRNLRISVPRSSYITDSFTDFVSILDKDKPIEIYFSETNSIQAIRNIVEHNYKLGIIRYPLAQEPYYLGLLEEHRLSHKEVLEYESTILTSAKGPLAACETIDYNDLEGLIEIVHGDLQLPNFRQNHKNNTENRVAYKRIYVYERGSQLDLLTRNENTYMWVSPMPRDTLNRGNLVQKRCKGLGLKHKDVLIKPKGHSLTPLEKEFVLELERAAQKAKEAFD